MGNVTGGNIVTGGIVTATGNIVGGNVSAVGTVFAPNANISTQVNTNTVNPPGGILSLTGNVLMTQEMTALGNIVMGQTIQGGSLVTDGNVTANVVTANTVALNNNLNVTGAITANTITANLALNIGNEPVATQADATALAIALG